MENENQSPFVFSEKSQSELSQTAKWAKYIALLAIAELAISAILIWLPYKALSAFSPKPMYHRIAALIIKTVIYIFPIYCLLQFCKFIKRGAKSRQAADFETALEHHRLNFKFIGIAIICLVCLFVLFFIGTIAVGFIAASNLQ